MMAPLRRTFLLFAAGLLAAQGAEAKNDFPFARQAWPTSSFAENRGSRYHAGVDLGTEMEQGWPVLAPEEGWAERVRVSPFFYGKNLLFRTKSGEYYLFAHLSGFPEPISKRVFEAMEKNRAATCDLQWNKQERIRFSKGDTIAFSGKTGIGNPHLHVERRNSAQEALNPMEGWLAAPDTIAPQFLEIALLKEGRLESVRKLGGSDSAVVVVPEKNANLILKIVDYSRDPRENPMSVVELRLHCGEKEGETLFRRRYEKLVFGKMEEVFQDLIWAREGEEFGDWHALFSVPREGESPDGDLNRCFAPGAREAGARAVATDMLGISATLKLKLVRAGASAPGQAPAAAAEVKPEPVPAAYADNQPGPVFTFLARPFLKQGDAGIPLDETNAPEGAVVRRIAAAGGEVSLRAGEWSVVLPAAASRAEQVVVALPSRDSTGAFLELHPKGLALRPGEKIRLCAPLPAAKAPEARPAKGKKKGAGKKPEAAPAPKAARGWGLFWRSEGAREWNAFSKIAPAPDSLAADARPDSAHALFCADVDEVRDVAVRRDTIAPELDSLRTDTLWLDGRAEPALSVLVTEKGGAGFGGARNFGTFQRAAADGSPVWVYGEYNLTDRRIRFPLSRLRSPEANVVVRVSDDFGNAVEREFPLSAFRAPAQADRAARPAE